MDRQMGNLALGAIFRMLSRPYKEGDDERYRLAKNIVMDAFEGTIPDTRPNWVRDRNRGAQGA